MSLDFKTNLVRIMKENDENVFDMSDCTVTTETDLSVRADGQVLNIGNMTKRSNPRRRLFVLKRPKVLNDSEVFEILHKDRVNTFFKRCEHERDEMPLPCVIRSRRLEQSVESDVPRHAIVYRSLACVSTDNLELSNKLTRSRENLTTFKQKKQEEKCSENMLTERHSEYAAMARQRVLEARRLKAALEVARERSEQKEREQKEKRRIEEKERKRIEDAKIADEMESKLLPPPESKSIDVEESDDENDCIPCPRPKSGHFWRSEFSSSLAAGSGVNAARQVNHF